MQYKIIYLTFKSLNGQSPQYLVDMLEQYTPVRELRSSSRNLLKIPNVKYKMTERAFNVAAPKLWNSFSDELWRITGTDNFKRQLKTYRFIIVVIITWTVKFAFVLMLDLDVKGIHT